MRHIKQRARFSGVLTMVAALVFVGLHLQQHRVRRAALGELGDAVRRVTEAPSSAIADLEQLAARAPSVDAHRAAALAVLARGAPLGAAVRHAELAARLDPDPVRGDQLARLAVTQVQLAKVRRLAGGAAILGFVLWAAGVLARRASRRRAQREADWAAGLRGEVRVSIDGERQGARALLPVHAHEVALDVHLQGRYGLVPKRCRARQAHLHVCLSHAHASQTVRLRPRPHEGARDVRMPLRETTLATLRRHPGPWRISVLMNDHLLAVHTLDVLGAQGLRSA